MSNKGPFIALRIIGFLVLIALIAVGGFMAYRAGVAQGTLQAPAVATAIGKAAENGQIAPMYGYGYGYGPGFYPFFGPHFGFFPFGICGSILLIFLIFGLLRFLFFRPWRMGWGHHHGPWGRHWEGGVPPMFNEWHKRAHGEEPEASPNEK